MLEFEDVKKCKTTEELNKFIQKYLDERGLRGEKRRKTMWALQYEWRDSLSNKRK